MRRKSWLNGFRISIALLVLAVAIVSRIPSSDCHCHEKKRDTTKVCPFGELRQIAKFFLIFAAPIAAAAFLRSPPPAAARLLSKYDYVFSVATARGPPLVC